MSSRVLRLAAALTMAGVGVLAGAVPVPALTPDQVGWWDRVLTPVAGGPVSDPTVGSTEVKVANAPDGPSAEAAFRYVVSDPSVDASQATATLVLKVVKDSAVGTISAMACPTTASWIPANGGAWASRPSDTCATVFTPGKLAADGSTLTFTLGPAMQQPGDDGVFDIVVAPAAKAAPFSVRLAKPTSDSDFTVVAPSPTSASPSSSDYAITTDDSPAPAFESSPNTFSADTSSFSAPADTGTFATTGDSSFSAAAPASGPPARPAATAPPVAALAAPAAAIPPRVDDKRAQRVMAVALLAALAGALVWVGGQPVRQPRLLGSLSVGGSAAPAVERVGGVGRFARPRSGRPPRL